MVYISLDATEFFLSRKVTMDLGIVPKDYPRTGRVQGSMGSIRGDHPRMGNVKAKTGEGQA